MRKRPEHRTLRARSTENEVREMIAETGHYALILALAVAIVQTVLPLMGHAAARSATDERRRAGGAGRNSC